MEHITITDEEGVQAFIEAQEDARKRACATFIASRAALRAVPYAIQIFVFNSTMIKQSMGSIHGLRPFIRSSVAVTMPTDDNFLPAAKSAVAAAAALIATVIETATLTTDLTEFVKEAFAAAEPSSVADATDTANAVDADKFNITDSVYAAKAAASCSAALALFIGDIWAEVSKDAAHWLEHVDYGDGTLAIDIAPLWSVENPLEGDWHDLRQQLRDANTPDKRGADWSFWIRWYDDILAGNPQNWDMLHEIATTPEIDWEAPSREVNDKINGIVTRYQFDEAIKNHALDRKVVFNAQTKRLASENIEVRDLEEIVKSLRTALRQFVSRVTQDHAGNRMGAYVHVACELWIKRFRKEISKAKDSTSDLAHCVHMNLIELQKIIEIEAFQRDLDVNRLLSELEVIEQQIMIAAPEVLALRKDQNKVKIELYEDKYLLEAKRMTHGMMLDCEGPLEAVMAWVLYTLHDKSASAAQKKAAIGFALGALPRGARELMMNDIDGSDPSKDTNLWKRMGEVGDALHKADKGIDALQEFAVEGQELITEGGPWVTEFLSKLSNWL